MNLTQLAKVDFRLNLISSELLDELKKSNQILIVLSDCGGTGRLEIYRHRLEVNARQDVLSEIVDKFSLNMFRAFPKCVIIHAALMENNTPYHFIKTAGDLHGGDVIIFDGCAIKPEG